MVRLASRRASKSRASKSRAKPLSLTPCRPRWQGRHLSKARLVSNRLVSVETAEKVPQRLVGGKRKKCNKKCNKTLAHGVYFNATTKKYRARSSLLGKKTSIGTYDTAETAGKAVVVWEHQNRHLSKAKPKTKPMKVAEVHAAVFAEGLTLTKGSGAGGFMNVRQDVRRPGRFQACQRLDSKPCHHGSFSSPEEAALACARAFKAHMDRA